MLCCSMMLIVSVLYYYRAMTMIHAVGVIAAVVYTAIVTFVIFKLIDMTLGNRVSEDEELEGLDLVSHNERGYDL